jgi:hypothetical protein
VRHTSHHLPPAGNRRERKAVGDGLSHHHEVRPDAVPLTRPPNREPADGLDLVHHQQGTYPSALIAQNLEPLGIGLLDDDRLEHHGRQLVAD